MLFDNNYEITPFYNFMDDDITSQSPLNFAFVISDFEPKLDIFQDEKAEIESFQEIVDNTTDMSLGSS